ncbi:hypothetical protein [Streptomyces sp. NPDC056707]|uniref:hypothetical protein n=1 Tax=Streptomyces sp. NPDC056707 TaxID=3345919 RepID=UPI00367F7087
MSDLTSGTFGLIGVAVGAAATFAGTVWQQRKQADTQRQERERLRNEAAMDAAGQALLKVQDLFREVPPRDGTGQDEWKRDVGRHVDAALLPVSSLTDSTLRDRMLNVVTILENWEYAGRSAGSESWIIGEVCRHGIECLAAHRRGASLPGSNETVALASSHVSHYLSYEDEQRMRALADERSMDPP